MAADVLVSLAAGWVGGAITMAEVCMMVYVWKRRQLPVAIIACCLPYILFFQAGKPSFRQTYWAAAGGQATTFEKLSFWTEMSFQQWQAAFKDPSGKGVNRLLNLSLSRTSLLTLAATAVAKTPDLVPFQYGHLYSYIPISWVPRALWPDKPSMNDANQFYQVAYGITRKQDLSHVSISVGVLTEGYISASWFGTALIMFLVGALLDFWNTTFLGEHRNALAIGLGIAMIPPLMLIEFQMAQYVSGLVQHVFLTLLLFVPIMRKRKRSMVRMAANPGFQMSGVRPNFL